MNGSWGPCRRSARSSAPLRSGVRVLALLVMLGTSTVASAGWDVFDTQRAVGSSAAESVREGRFSCDLARVGNPLKLSEAIDLALCNNTQTRQAWAQVKIQTAAVGISKAAYLPTISASAQDVRDESSTAVANQPELSSNSRSRIPSTSISLNWVLFDFGGRDAALRNAEQLLAAASANQDATLRTVFATVSKDFYAAQAAQGAVSASMEIVRSAKESFEAASARVEKGVAPMSDSLQAETALAQATINRTKSHGEWQTALGVLASDMNLRADAALNLPAVEEGVKPDAEFSESISELMTQALGEHPSILKARADLRAAEAKADEIEAQGRPNIAMVAKSAHNNQPVSSALGQPMLPASARDWSIGVQLTIPLFEGFARSYQVRQARARVELQRVAIDQAASQVGLDVWTSFQALQTATQNVGDSARLLELATASRMSSEGRYQAGVGNILEVLSAQSALAAAKRQRVQALTDWRFARLLLAVRLGQAGKFER